MPMRRKHHQRRNNRKNNKNLTAAVDTNGECVLTATADEKVSSPSALLAAGPTDFLNRGQVAVNVDDGEDSDDAFGFYYNEHGGNTCVDNEDTTTSVSSPTVYQSVASTTSATAPTAGASTRAPSASNEQRGERGRSTAARVVGVGIIVDSEKDEERAPSTRWNSIASFESSSSPSPTFADAHEEARGGENNMKEEKDDHSNGNVLLLKGSSEMEAEGLNGEPQEERRDSGYVSGSDRSNSNTEKRAAVSLVVDEERGGSDSALFASLVSSPAHSPKQRSVSRRERRAEEESNDNDDYYCYRHFQGQEERGSVHFGTLTHPSQGSQGNRTLLRQKHDGEKGGESRGGNSSPDRNERSKSHRHFIGNANSTSTRPSPAAPATTVGPTVRGRRRGTTMSLSLIKGEVRKLNKGLGLDKLKDYIPFGFRQPEYYDSEDDDDSNNNFDENNNERKSRGEKEERTNRREIFDGSYPYAGSIRGKQQQGIGTTDRVGPVSQFNGGVERAEAYRNSGCITTAAVNVCGGSAKSEEISDGEGLPRLHGGNNPNPRILNSPESYANRTRPSSGGRRADAVGRDERCGSCGLNQTLYADGRGTCACSGGCDFLSPLSSSFFTGRSSAMADSQRSPVADNNCENGHQRGHTRGSEGEGFFLPPAAAQLNVTNDAPCAYTTHLHSRVSKTPTHFANSAYISPANSHREDACAPPTPPASSQPWCRTVHYPHHHQRDEDDERFRLSPSEITRQRNYAPNYNNGSFFSRNGAPAAVGGGGGGLSPFPPPPLPLTALLTNRSEAANDSSGKKRKRGHREKETNSEQQRDREKGSSALNFSASRPPLVYANPYVAPPMPSWVRQRLRGYERDHHKHWSVFTPDGIEASRPAVCHYLNVGRWITLSCDYFLHRFPSQQESRGHSVVFLHNAKPRDRFVFLIGPVEAQPADSLLNYFWKLLYTSPPLFALSQGRVRWAGDKKKEVTKEKENKSSNRNDAAPASTAASTFGKSTSFLSRDVDVGDRRAVSASDRSPSAVTHVSNASFASAGAFDGRGNLSGRTVDEEDHATGDLLSKEYAEGGGGGALSQSGRAPACNGSFYSRSLSSNTRLNNRKENTPFSGSFSSMSPSATLRTASTPHGALTPSTSNLKLSAEVSHATHNDISNAGGAPNSGSSDQLTSPSHQRPAELFSKPLDPTDSHSHAPSHTVKPSLHKRILRTLIGNSAADKILGEGSRTGPASSSKKDAEDNTHRNGGERKRGEEEKMANIRTQTAEQEKTEERVFGIQAVEVLHSDITAMDFNASLVTTRLAIESKNVRCLWFASKASALRHYGCDEWLDYYASVRGGGAGAMPMDARTQTMAYYRWLEHYEEQQRQQQRPPHHTEETEEAEEAEWQRRENGEGGAAADPEESSNGRGLGFAWQPQPQRKSQGTATVNGHHQRRDLPPLNSSTSKQDTTCKRQFGRNEKERISVSNSNNNNNNTCTKTEERNNNSNNSGRLRDDGEESEDMGGAVLYRTISSASCVSASASSWPTEQQQQQHACFDQTATGPKEDFSASSFSARRASSSPSAAPDASSTRKESQRKSDNNLVGDVLIKDDAPQCAAVRGSDKSPNASRQERRRLSSPAPLSHVFDVSNSKASMLIPIKGATKYSGGHFFVDEDELDEGEDGSSTVCMMRSVTVAANHHVGHGMPEVAATMPPLLSENDGRHTEENDDNTPDANKGVVIEATVNREKEKEKERKLGYTARGKEDDRRQQTKAKGVSLDEESAHRTNRGNKKESETLLQNSEFLSPHFCGTPTPANSSPKESHRTNPANSDILQLATCTSHSSSAGDMLLFDAFFRDTHQHSEEDEDEGRSQCMKLKRGTEEGCELIPAEEHHMYYSISEHVLQRNSMSTRPWIDEHEHDNRVNAQSNTNIDELATTNTATVPPTLPRPADAPLSSPIGRPITSSDQTTKNTKIEEEEEEPPKHSKEEERADKEKEQQEENPNSHPHGDEQSKQRSAEGGVAMNESRDDHQEKEKEKARKASMIPVDGTVTSTHRDTVVVIFSQDPIFRDLLREVLMPDQTTTGFFAAVKRGTKNKTKRKRANREDGSDDHRDRKANSGLGGDISEEEQDRGRNGASTCSPSKRSGGINEKSLTQRLTEALSVTFGTRETADTKARGTKKGHHTGNDEDTTSNNEAPPQGGSGDDSQKYSDADEDDETEDEEKNEDSDDLTANNGHPYTASVAEQLRLLALLEAGMPSWTIFCARWGFPYRRVMRLAIVAIVNIWPIIALSVGMYDLYKHMPYVRDFLGNTRLFTWISQNFALRNSLFLTYLLTVSFNITQSLHGLSKTVTAFIVFIAAPLQPLLVLFHVLTGPAVSLVVFLFSILSTLLQPIYLIVHSIISFVFAPYYLVQSLASMFGAVRPAADAARQGAQTVGMIARLWRYWLDLWEKVIRPVKNLAKATYDGLVHVSVAVSKRDTSMRRAYRQSMAIASNVGWSTYRPLRLLLAPIIGLVSMIWQATLYFGREIYSLIVNLLMLIAKMLPLRPLLGLILVLVVVYAAQTLLLDPLGGWLWSDPSGSSSPLLPTTYEDRTPTSSSMGQTERQKEKGDTIINIAGELTEGEEEDIVCVPRRKLFEEKGFQAAVVGGDRGERGYLGAARQGGVRPSEHEDDLSSFVCEEDTENNPTSSPPDRNSFLSVTKRWLLGYFYPSSDSNHDSSYSHDDGVGLASSGKRCRRRLSKTANSVVGERTLLSETPKQEGPASSEEPSSSGSSSLFNWLGLSASHPSRSKGSRRGARTVVNDQLSSGAAESASSSRSSPESKEAEVVPQVLQQQEKDSENENEKSSGWSIWKKRKR